MLLKFDIKLQAFIKKKDHQRAVDNYKPVADPEEDPGAQRISLSVNASLR